MNTMTIKTVNEAFKACDDYANGSVGAEVLAAVQAFARKLAFSEPEEHAGLVAAIYVAKRDRKAA